MSEIVLNTDDMPSSHLGPEKMRLYAADLKATDRHYAADLIRYLADAIEAQTKPPKPEEPRGLGAVVEDADGKRWVRCPLGDAPPWDLAHEGPSRHYDRIDAVRILSPGVTEDGAR